MRMSYGAHLELIALAAVLKSSVPETARVAPRPVLRPQRIALPQSVRTAFIPAALSGFAGFIVIRVFAAVSPELMRAVLGYRNSLIIGLGVFLIFLFSAVGQSIEQAIRQHLRQVVGCACLITGLSCVALCALKQSSIAPLVGAALCALGQGIGFRAAIGEIASKTPAACKAEVTSTFFVALDVAISLPVMGVGVAIQQAGVVQATVTYAALTIIVVSIALALLIRNRRGEQ
jgi:sugar phosphate permease